MGALLGQQNGREITIEHAFECLLRVSDDDEVLLHHAWFEERLQQSKSRANRDIISLYITDPFAPNSEGRPQGSCS